MLKAIFDRKQGVRRKAMADISWQKKQGLLNSCIAAFEADNADDWRIFLMGYLELKRGAYALDAAQTAGMDQGLANLVANPVMYMLERHKKPAAALRELTADMSDFYRQHVLDLTLRQACARGSWVAVAPLLSAGANVNTAHGRPLFLALVNNQPDIARALLKEGAASDLALALTDDKNRAAVTARLQALQPPAPAPKRAASPKPPAARPVIKKSTPPEV
jgi:hypothetical protein